MSSDARRALLATALTFAAGAPALAQPAARPAATFLPTAGASFTWAGLATPDPRFSWHGEVDFDLDVVDYGSGRVTFEARYEAVLGRERRRYDLNHGNYSFEFTASRRAGAAEIGALAQHVSRHLTDREQGAAISWNLVGGRAAWAWQAGGGTRLDARLDLGLTMQEAFVDYAWIARTRIDVRRPMTPRLELRAIATGEAVGVNRRVYDRDRVCGGRIEGGLRVNGGAAAVEFFGAYERRLDAFPADRFRVRWWSAGFRITALTD